MSTPVCGWQRVWSKWSAMMMMMMLWCCFSC